VPTVLTRNVVALSVVSLLNDAAGEMVMPLVPIFLATQLHAGGTALGAIEGVADAVASVLKVLAGRASDRLGRARPFVLAGYTLAALARPFLALATIPAHVLAVRLTDRVGKGLRTAPRDALLAASVAPGDRGAAFGFHRSMDHAGAVVGPLLALGVLLFVTHDLRTLFALAVVPGVLAALTVLFGVREAEVLPVEVAVAVEVVRPDLWRMLVPVGLVTLGTASDTFLMLVAGVQDHAPLEAIPALWLLLHLVRTGITAPGGALADRVGARAGVAAGWAVRAAVLGLLALSDDPWVTAVLVVTFGLAAFSEPAEKKLVAAWVGSSKRGTGFGWYHGVVGLTALPASLGFGILWDQASPSVAFGASASIVALATAALLVLVRR
jgi:sugar phosphate permease